MLRLNCCAVVIKAYLLWYGLLLLHGWQNFGSWVYNVFRLLFIMKKLLLTFLLMTTLSACASHDPNRTTRQKVIRAANLIVYTPLCIMYGICPDIDEDE